MTTWRSRPALALLLAPLLATAGCGDSKPEQPGPTAGVQASGEGTEEPSEPGPAAPPPKMPPRKLPPLSEEAKTKWVGTWVLDRPRIKQRLAQAVAAAVDESASKHEREIAGELATMRLEQDTFQVTLGSDQTATVDYLRKPNEFDPFTEQGQPERETGRWWVTPEGDLLMNDELATFSWWFRPIGDALEVMARDARPWIAISGARGFYTRDENIPLARK